MAYVVVPSTRFIKNAKKLIRKQPQLKQKIKGIIKALRTNPTIGKLKFHKVGGKNNWAVSVNRDIRIIIHWEDNVLYLTNIGSHDEVY